VTNKISRGSRNGKKQQWEKTVEIDEKKASEIEQEAHTYTQRFQGKIRFPRFRHIRIQRTYWGQSHWLI
jgi:hypothetical protein